MEDQLNLVRSIFSSDGFRNADQDQQRVIIGQIIETRELSQEQIMKLYDESQDLSNLPGLSNTSNISVSQATQLANLPYDVFTNIILTGDIRGEDLLSLCNSSKVIQEYCNRALVLPTGQKVSQYLYRQLIEKERPGYLVGDQEQPRDVYQQLTTKKLEDFSVMLKFLEDVQNYELMDSDEGQYLIPPKTIQMLLYNYTQDQWGLLFRGLNLDITKPNINRAIAVKAFLDESTTLLVTNIFMIAALSDLPGSSQPGPFRPSILQNTAVFNILDDVNRIWENTRSFPDVLNHVLRALKIDLETLVKRLRTAAAATGHSSISTALTRFPDDKDVVNMWKNYEGFYIVSLNILLPKDNISLDKLIYDGLLEIGRSFIERYSDMMEDYSEMENTKQTIDQQYFTLNGLSQVVLDLQHGVYNRIIKWLVNIHKGVLSGQYSLFMPLIQLPK